MKGIREIRRRIKAVKNTAQITKAMQLVASSKMKRAQDLARQAPPDLPDPEELEEMEESERDRLEAIYKALAPSRKATAAGKFDRQSIRTAREMSATLADLRALAQEM